MDESGSKSFLENEYCALRREIEQARSRAFKIFAASLLVIPAGETLAKALGSGPFVKLVLPLILIAFYAMFRSQVLATQRAGLYIRTQIEPKMAVNGAGWEIWLRERRHIYDEQLALAFYVLSACYYLATAYAASTARVEDDPYLARLMDSVGVSSISAERLVLMMGLYLLIGILAVVYIHILPNRALRRENQAADGKPEAI